jgi:hypothetical protein
MEVQMQVHLPVNRVAHRICLAFRKTIALETVFDGISHLCVTEIGLAGTLPSYHGHGSERLSPNIMVRLHS